MYFACYNLHSSICIEPARWISWTDQLNGSAGGTSSLYLKLWPVPIFKVKPFSLYVVAGSESDDGLVFIILASLYICKG